MLTSGRIFSVRVTIYPLHIYAECRASRPRFRSGISPLSPPAASFCFAWSLQSKKKLERTKRVLEVGTGLYTVVLLLMSVFGQKDLAMVMQLGAIGVGLTACGSGAAKVSVGVSRVFNQPVDCGKE